LATPTKQQIINRAKELWHEQEARNGNSSFDINPELEELREQGLLAVAQSELMYSDSTKYELEKWEKYAEQMEQPKTENFEEKQTVSEIPFNLNEAYDTGLFTCGANQSRKTTLNKHLVQHMINNGVIVNVLDISRAWSVEGETPIRETIVIPDTDRPDVQFDICRNIVFDMSELSLKHRLEFANAFTKTVYDWQKSFGYKRAPFRFVVYEEAQGYIANGSFRSLRKFSPIVDMISVGANFNIRAALITPFPANVDKAPVKSAQQRYFGWTTEKNDIDYVKKFVGKERVPELKNLQKGEFMYQRGTHITKFSVERFGSVAVNKQSEFNYNLVYAL
jgi:hypothetical protein